MASLNLKSLLGTFLGNFLDIFFGHFFGQSKPQVILGYMFWVIFRGCFFGHFFGQSKPQVIFGYMFCVIFGDVFLGTFLASLNLKSFFGTCCFLHFFRGVHFFGNFRGSFFGALFGQSKPQVSLNPLGLPIVMVLGGAFPPGLALCLGWWDAYRNPVLNLPLKNTTVQLFG